MERVPSMWGKQETIRKETHAQFGAKKEAGSATYKQ